MLTLSIRPPWAWAIITQGKDIENRSWKAWKKLQAGDRFAIHASSQIDRAAVRALEDFLELEQLPPEATLRGHILGTVQFDGCVESSQSEWFFGPIGWKLSNPETLATPLPIPGRLGLWECPFDLPPCHSPACESGEIVEHERQITIPARLEHRDPPSR